MTRTFIPTGSELVEQPRVPEPDRDDPVYLYWEDYDSDYLKYHNHLKSLTRYTINPSDWTQGEEIKEGEFEVETWCNNHETLRGRNTFVSKVDDRRCANCYLFATPKRKEQGQEDLWEDVIRKVIEAYLGLRSARQELQQHYTLTKK